MVAVCGQIEKFGADARVAVVTFSQAQHVAQYLERMTQRLGYSISPSSCVFLLDPDRNAYGAYGLERASTAQIYSPPVGRRYREILKDRGRTALRRPVDDTHQLGGDFVVDPIGALTYGRWSKHPADRPPVAHLVAATRVAGLADR